MRQLLSVLLALPAVAGCVEAPTEVGTADEAITGAGATTASQFHRDRAAAISGCTATRISPTFAVTAIHCATPLESLVQFYDTESTPDVALTALVAQRIPRDVNIDADVCHHDYDACFDANGDFADLALLRLYFMSDGMDGASGAQATMAWAYPGLGVAGYAVGAGQHGGRGNSARLLKQIADTTDTTDASDGMFYLTNDDINHQDSGGPFYVQQRQLGVVWGHGLAAGYGNMTRYTSVPKHLDWILDQIGYAWGGAPPLTGMVYHGTLIQSIAGTERMCQYACEKTSSCEVYQHSGNSCGLYKGVNGWHVQAGRRGAVRHGAATGKSGAVVAYRRGDGYSSVLHRALDGSLHELFNAGPQWGWGSLPVPGAQPVPSGARLSGYRRSDGIDAVVYRSSSGHLIEVANDPNTGWTPADLTTTWSGATVSGDPTAYVRADGVSAIVYRSGTHVHELRLGPDGWIATDLHAVSGLSAAASGDPTPFVRADGLSSVVFHSGGAVIELFKRPGDEWSFGFPSSLVVNGVAPPAAAESRPYGSTRRNGVTGIVYRTTANRLVELRNEATGWRFEDLTMPGQAVSGNPVAYVRTDGVDSVVYRTGTGQLIEITRTPLQSWNLSVQYTIPALTTDPVVYQRVDGANAIVYGLANGHVGELSYSAGDTAWGRSDLTFSAGETP